MKRSAVTALVLLAALLFERPAEAGAPRAVSHRDSLFDIAARGNDVFVVGYPGILLRSRDGGALFERVELGTTQALFAIDVLADGRAVIVGRSGLVLTSEDGTHWTTRDAGTEASLFDVDMTPDGQAWAVGHFGTILHSKDAGHSWAVQSYDPALARPDGAATDAPARSIAEEENEGAAAEARLNGVAFADGALGFVVGEFGLVLRTEDGGEHWTRLAVPTGKLLFDVYVSDTRRLTIVGAEGTWIASDDAGVTWKAIASGTTEHLLAASEHAGARVATGHDGFVLLEDPAQRRIDRRASGARTWIGSVAFSNASLGFLAGGNGSLWRTRDGGRSFERVFGD